MLAARRVSNRAALRPEPAAGSAGTTALRIRLPDGSTHMRKFASAASLQVCHQLPHVTNTCLACVYPGAKTAILKPMGFLAGARQAAHTLRRE